MAVEKAFDVERTPVPGILAGIAGVLSPVPARGVMSPFDKRGAAAVTAVVLIGGCAAASAQDDGPAVLPYRPSVASPADLPAHGWPELEAGLQWTKGGNTARSKAALMTFKLAWTESWAMLIGTDAYAWQRAADGSTAQGVGDTTLTLKYELPVDDHLALGAELRVTLLCRALHNRVNQTLSPPTGRPRHNAVVGRPVARPRS